MAFFDIFKWQFYGGSGDKNATRCPGNHETCSDDLVKIVITQYRVTPEKNQHCQSDTNTKEKVEKER